VSYTKKVCLAFGTLNLVNFLGWAYTLSIALYHPSLITFLISAIAFMASYRIMLVLDWRRWITVNPGHDVKVAAGRVDNDE